VISATDGSWIRHGIQEHNNVPEGKPMKNDIVIMFEAKTLAQKFAADKDGLKRFGDELKKTCDELEAARVKITDATLAAAAAEDCKNASDNLTVAVLAMVLLVEGEAEASKKVAGAKAAVRSYGLLTHKTVSTGSIMDAAKGSWLSRVF
jgi:hypothetical protein